jgi:hypothetical protein
MKLIVVLLFAATFYQSSTAQVVGSRNSSCSTQLTSIEGTISSPNYPGRYNDSSNVCWYILAPPGYLIHLTFNAFDTEENCDFVDIYDGPSTDSPRLLHASGQHVDFRWQFPAPVDSSSSEMLVVFKSDSSFTYPGFQATYYAAPSDSTTTVAAPRCASTILTSPNGTVTSPNFPQDYGNDLNCTWLIGAPPGNLIVFALNLIDLEGSYTTEFGDYVRVYDGASVFSPVLLYASQWRPPPAVVSSSNRMLITFITDNSEAGQGFHASYSQCSELAGVSGSISSPNYPDNYDDNTVQCWIIAGAAEASVVQVSFDSFQLEDGWDRLWLYDGRSRDSPLLLYATGYNVPSPVVSTSNQVMVIFQTDDAGVRQGFQALYSVLD